VLNPLKGQYYMSRIEHAMEKAAKLRHSAGTPAAERPQPAMIKAMHSPPPENVTKRIAPTTTTLGAMTT
jgi:hypothetical protein